MPLARIAIGVAGWATLALVLAQPAALAQGTGPQLRGSAIAPRDPANALTPPADTFDAALPAAAAPVADLRRASDGDEDGDDPLRDPFAVPQDGDLSFPREAAQQRDGDIADGQPLPTRDGLQDLRAGDLRQADSQPGNDAETGNSPGTLLDIAVNGRPSLGFETDFDYVNGTNAPTRAARAFTAQPYDALGISTASFRLFPQLETSGVYFGNVFRSSSGAKQDAALDVRPTLRLVSNWSVHALDVTVSGDRSLHDRFAGEDDKAYAIDAKGRIDITRRSNVELQLQSSFQQEQRGSINDPSTAGSRVNAELNTLTGSYNQRFNRLALQVRGAITDSAYSGGLATTPERNSTRKDVALRASYEVKGGVSVFAEEATNLREFERVQSSDGSRRDSTGTRIRAGMALATTFWTGEASLGTARQEYADRRLAPVDGILIDASLTWRPSATDAVLFTARSDITDSTLAGSGGGLSRNLGVEYRHNLARYWLVSGGLAYSIVDYGGVGVSERQWQATLGTEYYLSRRVVLFGRYDHFDFTSSQSGRDFIDDQLRVGVRLRQ